MVESHTWDEAHRTNKQLSAPNKMPELYKSFWDDYEYGGFKAVLNKYYNYDEKVEREALWACWKKAHMYLIPQKLMKLLRK